MSRKLRRSALPKLAGTLGLASLLVLGLSVSPAMAQSTGWNITVTYGSALPTGQNELITALVTFNGALMDPSAVNGSLITPLGAAVKLSGFIEVTTGLWQTLYQLPSETGSYVFSVTAYNGTSTATAWGTFTGLEANSAKLGTIQSSIGSVQNNVAVVQSMLGNISQSLKSSDASLTGALQSSYSSLTSQIGGVQSSLSSMSAKIDTLSNNVSNTQFYALGAMVVAFIAVIVAAYGALRKH